MYKNKGSLTIEASLVLFVFVFAFLFFMSFAKYSAVQNKVKHSLNQTAISMSARNNQLVQLSKILNKAAGLSTEKLAEWVIVIHRIQPMHTRIKPPIGAMRI